MKFGLMFFSGDVGDADRYRPMLDAAAFADRHAFNAVWTPERHFKPFGGLFPNPAVTGAALAMITQKVQIRAGSVIGPLHDPLRIAEEWSMVDNLSGGRAAVSFGSGWHADDFVLQPSHYESRRITMYEQIATVRELWRGGAVRRVNGRNEDVAVRIYPKPVQSELPIWVTSRGNHETFREAGRLGANLLTHLTSQGVSLLEEGIYAYRQARADSGQDPLTGIVSLMLHTLVGEAAQAAREPFVQYLRSWLALDRSNDGRHAKSDPQEEEMLQLTFERYRDSASLIGSLDTCHALVRRLAACGVDEIACLIDIAANPEQMMQALPPLAKLVNRIESDGL